MFDFKIHYHYPRPIPNTTRTAADALAITEYLARESGDKTEAEIRAALNLNFTRWLSAKRSLQSARKLGTVQRLGAMGQTRYTLMVSYD
jgi:hypothetical protein